MQPLGIISGTVFLHDQTHLGTLREATLETAFGPALVFHSPEIVFVPRHGKDSHGHILPHLINHPANMQAMKNLGVREIIGIHSTGSLKRRLKPGMLVVPDDYLMPTPGPTVVRDKPLHITPVLSMQVRQKWLAVARECGCEVVDGGTYWQTAGPRLETRAEVAMMSQFADLVGMTMASEAIIAQELGIPFASLCSVDNFAHGLEDKELTMEKILWHAQRNAEHISLILTLYLEQNRR
jgi:5'-methylthioadenosine phosphorylase